MRNAETKARLVDAERVKKVLRDGVNNKTIIFAGTDNQTDTYFKCERGKLKIREGNIENYLVAYTRGGESPNGQMFSEYSLVPLTPALKEAIHRVLAVDVVVKKERSIYFANNVKLHYDHVDDLGDFVEIEARDPNESVPVDELQEQCEHFVELFGIAPEDRITESYSSMLARQSS